MKLEAKQAGSSALSLGEGLVAGMATSAIIKNAPSKFIKFAPSALLVASLATVYAGSVTENEDIKAHVNSIGLGMGIVSGNAVISQFSAPKADDSATVAGIKRGLRGVTPSFDNMPAVDVTMALNPNMGIAHEELNLGVTPATELNFN